MNRRSYLATGAAMLSVAGAGCANSPTAPTASNTPTPSPTDEASGAQGDASDSDAASPVTYETPLVDALEHSVLVELPFQNTASRPLSGISFTVTYLNGNEVLMEQPHSYSGIPAGAEFRLRYIRQYDTAIDSARISHRFGDDAPAFTDHVSGVQVRRTQRSIEESVAFSDTVVGEATFENTGTGTRKFRPVTVLKNTAGTIIATNSTPSVELRGGEQYTFSVEWRHPDTDAAASVDGYVYEPLDVPGV